jgi:IS30 family transposase
MPDVEFNERTGRYLSFAEREEIALLVAKGMSLRAIAREPCRDPSTISRELRRNASRRGRTLTYRATVAQWHRDRRAARPKPIRPRCQLECLGSRMEIGSSLFRRDASPDYSGNRACVGC